MNEIERYWSDRERRNTVSLQGTIVAALSDGDYTVKLLHTQLPVRASRGNITVALTVNQVVYLGRTDGSGVTKNTGYVILGAAPSASKGASASPPSILITTKTASAVTRINPNPVTMKGGDTAAIVISGVGFTASTTITYSTGSLTNAVAPVITATQITLSVSAAVGITPGDCDLSIDGVTVGPKLFRISAVTVFGNLWALTVNFYLVKVDPNTNTVTTSAASSIQAHVLTAYGSKVYAIGSNGIATFDAATLGITNVTNPGYSVSDAQATYADGAVWFADGTAGFRKENPATATSYLTVGSLGVPLGCIYAGGYIYGYGTTTIYKINAVTGAVVASATPPDRIDYLAYDGTYLYGTSKTSGKLFKISASTLATSVTLTGLSAPHGVVYADGALYVAQSSAVTKHQVSDLAQIASVANTQRPKSLAFDTINDRIWTNDGTNTAGNYLGKRYDPATLAAGTSVTLATGTTESLIFF